MHAVYDGTGKGMNTRTESCPNLKVQPGGYILVAQLLQHGTTKWFIESLRSTNENHHIICRCWPWEVTKTAKISVAVCFCWSLGKLCKKWVTQHGDLGPTPWLVSGKIETETIYNDLQVKKNLEIQNRKALAATFPQSYCPQPPHCDGVLRLLLVYTLCVCVGDHSAWRGNLQRIEASELFCHFLRLNAAVSQGLLHHFDSQFANPGLSRAWQSRDVKRCEKFNISFRIYKKTNLAIIILFSSVWNSL